MVVDCEMAEDKGLGSLVDRNSEGSDSETYMLTNLEAVCCDDGKTNTPNPVGKRAASGTRTTNRTVNLELQ